MRDCILKEYRPFISDKEPPCVCLVQQPPDEDSISAMSELLPALERRDGLSGGSSFYHMTLSDPFALTALCSNSSTDSPGHSGLADRTVAGNPASKRSLNSSPSSGLSAKKAKRRTSDRLPLVQHNTEKNQNEPTNVSAILQQHNKTSVCVC